jgi:lipopolysaccharide transport system ATP-binding protein
MRAVLEVKNVTKTYRIYRDNFDRLRELFGKKILHREFTANDDISFSLYEGETLGIIGVNGAGKSTLLKIIADVVVPTSGEVVRHGRVTALLELGTGFNPKLSGYDNIFLNGELIGMSRKEIEEKIDDIVEFSELGEYIDEAITTYSSGMVMRLAFSIAIHSRPSILIVDEALSVGDAHFSAKCTKALREMKKESMSIIYVSHDLNSLKLLCDRMLLLDGGRIVDEGEPDEVVNHYNYLIAKLNEKSDIAGEVKLIDPKTHGTCEAEFVSALVVGAESGADLISSGEEAYIFLDILSHVDMDDVSVGIMIRDRYGQDIYGTRSFDHGVSIRLRAGERRRIRYRIRMNLGAGKYSLSSAIHRDVEGENRRLYWRDDIASFEVAGCKGAMFSGICRLEPDISMAEVGGSPLLVTTSHSLLLIDPAGRRGVVIDRGRGLYYGLTSDGERLYVGARRRMVSDDGDHSQERGVILTYDRSLRLVEVMEPDFPLRDLHQIKFVWGRLHATCSYDNMVAIYEDGEWRRWYPFGREDRDIYHFNSIWTDGDKLYLMAHNFGKSDICVFDKNYDFIEKIPLGRSAHNIWRGEEGYLRTLSSEESKIVEEVTGESFHIGEFPRGIAQVGESVYIGLSPRAKRSERDSTDAILVEMDRSMVELSRMVLRGEGMLLDILPVGERDRLSGDGLPVDMEDTPSLFEGREEIVLVDSDVVPDRKE